MRLESALVAAGFWNPWTRCYGAGKDYVLPLRVVQQKASWQGRTGCSLQLKFCSCSHTPTDPCCCGGYHLFSPRPPPPFRPVFQGSGRGMLASESIGMVDIALEIPESLFISKELLGQSELAGLDEAELCGNIGFFINGFKHEGQDHDGQNHNLSCKKRGCGRRGVVRQLRGACFLGSVWEAMWSSPQANGDDTLDGSYAGGSTATCMWYCFTESMQLEESSDI